MQNHEVLTLLNDARVLVAPSVQDKNGDIDGIPNVLIEAMAMERAVIGSNISGIPEVVTDRTGILVSPGSASALARAIKRMLTNEEHAIKCGKAGRALVESSFDTRKNILKQLALLNETSPGQTKRLAAAGDDSDGRKTDDIVLREGERAVSRNRALKKTEKALRNIGWRALLSPNACVTIDRKYGARYNECVNPKNSQRRRSQYSG
jgi:hypothetical protein